MMKFSSTEYRLEYRMDTIWEIVIISWIQSRIQFSFPGYRLGYSCHFLDTGLDTVCLSWILAWIQFVFLGFWLGYSLSFLDTGLDTVCLSWILAWIVFISGKEAKIHFIFRWKILINFENMVFKRILLGVYTRNLGFIFLHIRTNCPVRADGFQVSRFYPSFMNLDI